MSLQVEDYVVLDVGEGEEYGVIVADLNPGTDTLYHVRLEESGERHNVEGYVLTLACPFCGLKVDSDWRSCRRCQEPF